MEIRFSPNKNHELILRVLHETGCTKIFDLESLLISICAVEENLLKFIEILNSGFVDLTSFTFRYFHDGYFFRKNTGDANKLENDIKGLEFVELLEIHGAKAFPISWEIELTDEGKRIAKSIKKGRRFILRPRKEFQTSIFIASAFGHNEIDRLFHNELAPICEEMNYEPVRVDLSEPTQTITELMMKSITEAACIIADLTHARPSVYFEVGYAHGLGIPLLLICRKDHYRSLDDSKRIHFDLEQYKISFWTTNSNDQFEWGEGMSPKERLSLIISTSKDFPDGIKDISAN